MFKPLIKSTLLTAVLEVLVIAFSPFEFVLTLVLGVLLGMSCFVSSLFIFSCTNFMKCEKVVDGKIESV